MRPPAVSVLMPVHNVERYVEEAVRSILAQTLSDLELILVDDGSTDSTGSIVRRLADSDGRIRLTRHPQEGLPRALNRGLAQCRAPLAARMDGDDVSLPDRLRIQSEYLRDHPRAALVGAAVELIDSQGAPAGRRRLPFRDREIRSALREINPIVHGAVMMRVEAVRTVGGYRPPFRVAEDLDLWLRLSERYELANVPDPLLRFRVHSGQTTREEIHRMSLYACAARLFAKIRARTGRDPAEGRTELTWESLQSLGADPRELQRSRIAHHLARISDLIAVGDLSEAETLYEAVRVDARRHLIPRRWSSFLRLPHEILSRRGRRVEAGVEFMNALLAIPDWPAAAAIRWAARRVGFQPGAVP